jgi:hypothetical protein
MQAQIRLKNFDSGCSQVRVKENAAQQVTAQHQTGHGQDKNAHPSGTATKIHGNTLSAGRPSSV